MSDIFKEMSSTILKDPAAISSSEAAHAALLLSHVAWNRAIGEGLTDAACRGILRKFEKSRSSLWKEFPTKDWKSLIGLLIEYKKTHYPDDNRVVVVCGMRKPGVIHVEWKYAEKTPVGMV